MFQLLSPCTHLPLQVFLPTAVWMQSPGLGTGRYITLRGGAGGAGPGGNGLPGSKRSRPPRAYLECVQGESTGVQASFLSFSPQVQGRSLLPAITM